MTVNDEAPVAERFVTVPDVPGVQWGVIDTMTGRRVCTVWHREALFNLQQSSNEPVVQMPAEQFCELAGLLHQIAVRFTGRGAPQGDGGGGLREEPLLQRRDVA